MEEKLPVTDLPVFFFVFRGHEECMKRLDLKLPTIQDPAERTKLKDDIKEVRDAMYWACRADLVEFEEDVQVEMKKAADGTKALQEKYPT